MSKDLTLLFDMDNISVNFLGYVIKIYNEDYGSNLTLADMTKEEFTDCLTPDRIHRCECEHLDTQHKDSTGACSDVGCTCHKLHLKPVMTNQQFTDRYMYGEDFFAKMDPLPGGLEGMKLLHEEGHELIITTSQSGPHCAFDKLEWLKKWCPWWTRKDVLMGHKKWKIKGDILIDDYPRNIINYKKEWPDSLVFTIHYPYNEKALDKADYVAEDCFNTWSAWMDLCEKIDEVSRGVFVKVPWVKPQLIVGV